MTNQRTDRLRVLVVEDDPDCASSTAMLLHVSGHEAHIGTDGPSGVRKARELAPDVVLLDIGLPGMSGYDVARRLRADSEKPPFIIAVSGHGQEEAVRQSREAGIDLHLVKPVDPAALAGLLSRFENVVRERVRAMPLGSGD
jgi:DNA-binding response OmpR family regulator